MKPQMTAVQLVRDNKAGHCRSGSTGEAGKCPFFKKHEGFLIAWMEVLGKTEPQAGSVAEDAADETDWG